MSRQPTRTYIAADETGTERDAFRMLPINQPMGAGMETRSNLFPSQLGGGELTVTPQGFQNMISPQQEFPSELGDNLVGPLKMTRTDPTFVFDYGFCY